MGEPYKSNTEGIEVSVNPEYLESQSSLIDNFFIWAYHVKINNRSSEPVQLISRYWKIFDEKGILQEVSGDGAVGEKPIIMPDSSFEYNSVVHLRSPSGIMSGYYLMKKDNGETINVAIPAFSLDTPSSGRDLN